MKYFIRGTWYTGPSVRPGITMVRPAPLFRWVGADGKKVLFYYYDDYAVIAGGEQWGEPLSEETIANVVQEVALRLFSDVRIGSRLGNTGYGQFKFYPQME